MTPSQTIGPFFHGSLTANANLGCLRGPGAKGEPIRIRFRVLDGEGKPVDDAMIEIWQADAAGVYQHAADPRATHADPAFRGFGRLATNANGACTFETVYPGRITPEQAPHINVSVFARGLLNRVSTRVYFEIDAADPVLALVPEDRRSTLIASRDPSDPAQWNFDIHLQGEQETVFFDL